MKNKIVLIPMLAYLIVGCSSKPLMTPELSKAQKAYVEIKNNEEMHELVPLELINAGKTYSQSQLADSEEDAAHLAYLLKNQVALAKESAKSKQLLKREESLKIAKAEALLGEKEQQLLMLQKENEKAKLEAAEKEQKINALQELNAQQTNRGLVLTLGDVLFETGSANLLSGSVRAIEKLSEFLIDNPKRSVLIEGHTDNVGSPAFNLDLSLRRAGSVQEALVAKGIEATRLQIKGYGLTYPIASNADEGGRQRNRRVEIIILEEGVDPSTMTRENQTTVTP